MPVSRPAAPYPIPNVSMTTWLVRFDEKGVCTSPATRDALLQTISKEQDVIYFSHGWKTDFGGAIEQYGDFLRSLEETAKSNAPKTYNPIFVGITWPSRWFPTNAGPDMAAAGSNQGPASGPEDFCEEIGRGLSVEDAAHFYALAQSHSLSANEALSLADLALKAQPINQSDDLASTSSSISAEELVTAWKVMGNPRQVAPIDPDGAGVVGGGGAAVEAAGGGFDPIDFIRVFSLFQMKDRAAEVGARGVAQLLTDLTKRARSVHVVGHSFGAKVMLSAVLGDKARDVKPTSLLLLQPALSYLCFAKSLPKHSEISGGYRPVRDLVEKPILTTFSRWDSPLHDIFHLAVIRESDAGEIKVAAAGTAPNRFAALGGYGPFAEDSIRSITPIPAPGTPIVFALGDRVVGLDGGTPDKAIGGHMDVANRFTAWALLQQF